MNCNLPLNGLERHCEDINGSIAKVLIAPLEYINTITINDGEVTALSMTGSFMEYEFRQDQAFYNANSEISFENSTTIFNPTLTIHIDKLDPDTRNELMVLSKGQRELGVIFQDDAGIYWTIGLNEKLTRGARVSELNSEIGATLGDVNRYTLVISAVDKQLEYSVDDAVVVANS